MSLDYNFNMIKSDKKANEKLSPTTVFAHRCNIKLCSLYVKFVIFPVLCKIEI